MFKSGQMSAQNADGPEWFPKEVQVIADLATLQVVADPLRLRILELLRREPRAVKEIAAALNIAPTKLYYHIKLLEGRDLIRVAETRVVSGLVEKRYRVTAYRLSVDRTLLSPDATGGTEGIDTFLSVVLDHTRSEIQRSVAAGLVNLDQKSPRQRGLVLGRKWLRLTPEEAEAFYLRLMALEGEFSALHPAGEDTDLPGQLYELLLGLYATVPPSGGDAPPPANHGP